MKCPPKGHPEHGPCHTSMFLCIPAQLYYSQKIAVTTSEVMRMQHALPAVALPLP